MQAPSAVSTKRTNTASNIKNEPKPSTSSFAFGTEDVIYGSNFDVFQEVIVEEEVQEINVETSRSNSPISVTIDSNSNENSVGSFTASETQNQYWTREDLTPSDVLPDNLFTETEEENFSLDDPNNCDASLSITDDTGFSVTNLFPIKEEPLETEIIRSSDNGVEQVKKATRRKIKQEPTEAVAPSKYNIFHFSNYLKLFT